MDLFWRRPVTLPDRLRCTRDEVGERAAWARDRAHGFQSPMRSGMARRNSRAVVAIGLCALICLVVAGTAGYFRYVNQLPDYPSVPVVMPVPNAYDDYVAAGLLC